MGLRWRWTFNETGAEADNRGEPAPATQTYTTGNPVVASVQLTDNGGALVTDSVTITVHGWAAPQTLDSTCNVGYYTSLAVVDGNPAISNCDYSNIDL